MARKVSLAILIFISILLAESKTVFKGQFVGAPNLNYQSNELQLSGYSRYIPIFKYTKYTQGLNYSTDIAGNFFTDFESDPETKLYRLKLGIFNNQSELRLGLQKLNFGPAQVLRSLQWFDTISPTDPLKLTDGVYGLLFRHYFLSNDNIWLWSLYGNNDRKGIEIIKTKKNSVEFGGRGQAMIFNGEMGITTHFRQLPNDQEYRLALDGRWDFFMGTWFEAVHQRSEAMKTNRLTLGIDYTFNIGNGLYCMGEHLISDLPGTDGRIDYSSVMITYPVTFFDNLTVINYYNWESTELSQYLSWQRTYNRVMINMSLFHYPENPTMGQALAGYGIELKMIYNH